MGPSLMFGQTLKRYNREALSLIYTHLTFSSLHERERETKGGEIDRCSEYFFFLLIILLFLIILWGFLLYGFPCENMCLVYILYLMHIYVLVILSYKYPNQANNI